MEQDAWEAIRRTQSLPTEAKALELTIGGLQAVGETQRQVSLGEKFSSFLAKVNHHRGKVLCLLQLQGGEAKVSGRALLALVCRPLSHQHASLRTTIPHVWAAQPERPGGLSEATQSKWKDQSCYLY